MKRDNKNNVLDHKYHISNRDRLVTWGVFGLFSVVGIGPIDCAGSLLSWLGYRTLFKPWGYRLELTITVFIGLVCLGYYAYTCGYHTTRGEWGNVVVNDET